MPVVILRPSAIGTYDSWTLGAGATKVAAVDPSDPVVHDADTSYISITAGAVNLKQSFVLDNGLPTATILTVNAFSMNTRARTTSGVAGTESYFQFVRRASTDGAGISDSPGTAYQTKTTNPFTRPGGGSWVAADFVPGNIQGAVQTANGSALAFRVTSLWGELDFVAPTGGNAMILTSLLGPLFGAGLLLREVAAAAQLLAARSQVLLTPEEVRVAWRELLVDRRRVYLMP
jgi:hypothetical protein